MIILSIDVGMKNLAYCLFKIKDSMEFEILQWNVLNLCQQEVHLCQENKKNKIKCNKKAKYTKENKYYCKIHAKNKSFLIPDAKFNKHTLHKFNLSQLRSIIQTEKIEIKKKTKKDEIKEILKIHFDEKYFDIVSKIKANDMNLVSYGRSMKDLFNEELKDINIDIVCIENQIGPLALRMKTLQGMIMQHFIEKNIPLVEEVSATNKLKEFLDLKKTTYSQRKKISVEETKKLLSKNNHLHKWINIFSNHKKKDDLADCFLQGRWYLKNSILKNN